MSRDRDQILEQALKHELRGDATPTAQLARRSFSEGGCLDAETLAAWQDDALNAAQMADVEMHVSACARCQLLLAAFARGGEAPVAPASAEPDRFRWWKWWLAPLAAGAAAVTLWMVVPEQQQIATAPPPQPASVSAERAPASPPAAFAQKKEDTQAPQPEQRARAADSDLKENKLKSNAARDDRQPLKDQAVPAPKEEVAIAQAAPTAPPAPRSEAAGARVAELEKSTRLAFAPLEVPTLDRNVRWRINGGHAIERTDDNGANWRTLATVTDVMIGTGSAPSSAVAWFAGVGGTVVVTTDGGVTFQTLHLDEPLDIASISAIDARTATVSTVSGRRFRTEDGGRTWRAF